MAWSEGQQLALAMVPKFSSVLSLFGSFWITIEVLTDTTAEIPKRKHPYHRLLLAMSVYDILESFWNFLSTWPIPKGTEGVWHPIGNTQTCTAQGFFLTLSVAVPIYNAMLSLYYLLVIKYNVKDEILRKRVEPAMHGIAFVWAFGTALVSAWMGLINNANLWCWIAPYPAGCKDSRRYGDEGNCERGDNAWIYRWAFYFAPLWACILFATVCTVMVYFKVHKYDQISLQYRKPERVSFMGARLTDDPRNKRTESQLDRNSMSSQGSFAANIAIAARKFLKDEDNNSDDSETDNPPFVFEGLEQIAEEENAEVADEPTCPRRNSFSEFRTSVTTTGQSVVGSVQRWKARRKEFAEDNPRTIEVFRQALWYLLTFYVTHAWSTSNRIIQQTNDGETYFGLILVHSFFDPLQGFLNFVVYQRPRFMRIRKEYPHLSRMGAIIRVLRFSYLPPPPERETIMSSRVSFKQDSSVALPVADSTQESPDDSFRSDMNDSCSKKLAEASECEPIPEDEPYHNPDFSTLSFSESHNDDILVEPVVENPDPPALKDEASGNNAETASDTKGDVPPAASVKNEEQEEKKEDTTDSGNAAGPDLAGEKDIALTTSSSEVEEAPCSPDGNTQQAAGSEEPATEPAAKATAGEDVSTVPSGEDKSHHQNFSSVEHTDDQPKASDMLTQISTPPESLEEREEHTIEFSDDSGLEEEKSGVGHIFSPFAA